MTAEEWIDGLREVVEEVLHVDVSGARLKVHLAPKAHWLSRDEDAAVSMVVVTMRVLSTGKKLSQSFMVSGGSMVGRVVPQTPAGWLWERMSEMWGEVFTMTFVVAKRRRRPEVVDDR